jgi:hypothetical protein
MVSMSLYPLVIVSTMSFCSVLALLLLLVAVVVEVYPIEVKVNLTSLPAAPLSSSPRRPLLSQSLLALTL